MAYLGNHTQGNQRLATMTVVALIQGAVIFALIKGLAVTFIDRPPPERTTAEQIELEPIPTPIPPPPLPKPPETVDTRVAPVKPLVHLPSANAPEFVDVPLPPLPPIGDMTLADPVPSSTPALITPRAPKPRNAAGTWATTNDYPARDLREGNQGTVGFLLTVGTDGKVLSCAVTRPSGHPGLDKAACDNVTRRARFDPATDETGARVTGTYGGTIRWTIPRD